MNRTHMVPDEQPKLVLLKDSFSQRTRILSLKNLTPRRLHTVESKLACAESDSTQFLPAQSLTAPSVSLHGVTYFANISTKTNLSAKSGAQVGWIDGEKNANKSCDTATLS